MFSVSLSKYSQHLCLPTYIKHSVFSLSMYLQPIFCFQPHQLLTSNPCFHHLYVLSILNQHFVFSFFNSYLQPMFCLVSTYLQQTLCFQSLYLLTYNQQSVFSFYVLTINILLSASLPIYNQLCLFFWSVYLLTTNIVFSVSWPNFFV